VGIKKFDIIEAVGGNEDTSTGGYGKYLRDVFIDIFLFDVLSFQARKLKNTKLC
jgi:hypothetical protein